MSLIALASEMLIFPKSVQLSYVIAASCVIVIWFFITDLTKNKLFPLLNGVIDHDR